MSTTVSMTKKAPPVGREVAVPPGSALSEAEYLAFLCSAHGLLCRHALYLPEAEDMTSLELAHLVPSVRETIVALYVGINDAVCIKGLVAPFLIRHGHNNVFAFDPAVYAGGDDVPAGTSDARRLLAGFEPPNETWPAEWTYVMIADPARRVHSLWDERGYLDTIPAKQEDFTMMSDAARSRICFFIDPVAFDHPVNAGRPYLRAARDLGGRLASEFAVPGGLAGETDGLVPVILKRGEKLYVARTDFGPCAHAWSNLHRNNEEWAVVNEASAVPLNLVSAKPAPTARTRDLRPAAGSADMTTDWFLRGLAVNRRPILRGSVSG